MESHRKRFFGRSAFNVLSNYKKYISNHVVPDELRLLNWVILNLGEFINRIEGIGVSDGGELVHFGPGAVNVIEIHVELWPVDVGGDEDFGCGLVDIVVAIVKGFSGFDGFFDKIGPCAGDVVNLEWIPDCSFGPDVFLRLESGQVHRLRCLVIGEIC